MKHTLVLLFISIVSLSASAQNYKDNNYYYYDGIENRGDMGITAEQKNAIISIKKNIGRRHSEIGRDRSLRGYEKGQAHRALNLQIRKEIQEVLNSGQNTKWDSSRSSASSGYSSSSSYGSSKDVSSVEREIDLLEDEIDSMEDYYDDMIDRVEDDRSLSKEQRKERKRSLKAEKKQKKREMKRQKQDLKDSVYRGY